LLSSYPFAAFQVNAACAGFSSKAVLLMELGICAK